MMIPRSHNTNNDKMMKNMMRKAAAQAQRLSEELAASSRNAAQDTSRPAIPPPHVVEGWMRKLEQASKTIMELSPEHIRELCLLCGLEEDDEALQGNDKQAMVRALQEKEKRLGVDIMVRYLVDQVTLHGGGKPVPLDKQTAELRKEQAKLDQARRALQMERQQLEQEKQELYQQQQQQRQASNSAEQMQSSMQQAMEMQLQMQQMRMHQTAMHNTMQIGFDACNDIRNLDVLGGGRCCQRCGYRM